MVSRTRNGIDLPRAALLAQAALVTLLVVNAIYYARSGSVSKATDAAAWLALLLLFLTEAHFAPRTRGARVALRTMRFAAALAVIAAAAGYVIEGNRLDAINSSVWIAIVVLLEFEVRRPAISARRRIAVTALSIGLYGTLGVLVVIWAMRGEWMDAYDAALWLTAFALLETSVLARRSDERSESDA